LNHKKYFVDPNNDLLNVNEKIVVMMKRSTLLTGIQLIEPEKDRDLRLRPFDTTVKMKFDLFLIRNLVNIIIICSESLIIFFKKLNY
jgi:hypothetical protein